MFGKKKKLKIGLLGPIGSGKTTILYREQLDQTVDTVPTVDFYTEDLVIDKKDGVSVCDVGGPVMDLWLGTDTMIDGLIYVLDASREDHIDFAGELFEHAITCRKTDGVPLLIFCNKCDGPCVPVEDIKSKFGLEKLHRRWQILPCSGTTGMNIDEGFKWITQQAQEHKKELKSKNFHNQHDDYHYANNNKGPLKVSSEALKAEVK
jgi:small GTP-binding protein